MATREELREALDDYTQRAQSNERVRKTLKNWNSVIHLDVTDLGIAYTMTIVNGELTGIQDGAVGTPDLIVSGKSEDLTNIFWGDENPASNYMQGAITTRGSQEDVMRLDAMAMLLYLDAEKK
jgi:putative sterol carrier protein